MFLFSSKIDRYSREEFFFTLSIRINSSKLDKTWRWMKYRNRRRSKTIKKGLITVNLIGSATVRFSFPAISHLANQTISNHIADLSQGFPFLVYLIARSMIRQIFLRKSIKNSFSSLPGDGYR